MKLNLGNKEKFVREVVPAGRYPARLESCTLKESKSGNMMLQWVFELQDEDYFGRKIWKFTVLPIGVDENTEDAQQLIESNKKRADAIRQVLNGFADQLDLDLESGDLDFEPDDLVGLFVELNVSVGKDADGSPNNSAWGSYPLKD